MPVELKRELWSRIKNNPVHAMNVFCSILRGHLYVLKSKCLNQKVTVGRNFRVIKKLKIKGPGTVIIGDNVTINGRSHAVTPYTYSPQAVITIGSNVFLNGTRFGCRKSISIGEHCIVGDANLLDTDFHHLDPMKRHSPEPPPALPIVIEDNVWIAGAVIILKGVKIGKNSVIGAGSVVTRDVPPNCLAMGNPATVVKML